MSLVRFIIQYQNTDGYTFFCTETRPVEYSSIPEFLNDFELAAIKAYTQDLDTISVGRYTFPINAGIEDGEYYAPQTITLDEWFR
jgi:hypothetical protein